MKIKHVYLVTVIIISFTIFIVLFLIWNSSKASRDIPIYEISVIIDHKPGDYWNIVAKGIELAVSDYNAEISVLYTEEDGVSTLVNLINKEAENGAEAIIIAPSFFSEELRETVLQIEKKIAVIEIGSVFEDNNIIRILQDEQKMCETLAEEINFVNAEKTNVTPVTNKNPPAWVNTRISLLEKNLKNMGITLNPPVVLDESIEFNLDGIIVALDSDTLTKAATNIYQARAQAKIQTQPQGLSNNKDILLCGFGGTGAVVHFLENDTISFTVAENAFILGYLSIKTAVDSLNGKAVEQHSFVDYLLITPQNMHDVDRQRLLFPFVK